MSSAPERALAVAIAIAFAFALPAAAQDEGNGDAEREGFHAVVLTVGGDAPEAIAREAREVVAAVLEADGMRIAPEGDLALRVPPSRLHGCDSIACASRLGRELGVATVAAVAIWLADGQPSSVTVSLILGERRAHAATESVSEGVAAAARAAVRGAQDARARALAGSSPAASAGTEAAPDGPREDPVEEPVVEEPVVEARQRERSIEEYVLPGVLGAAGLAAVAGAVYAFMPEQCEQVAPSGTCLRGHGPNVGIGVLFAVTGGLGIAGAIVWLVVGGLPANMGPVNVVLGPDGGGVSWNGTF